LILIGHFGFWLLGFRFNIISSSLDFYQGFLLLRYKKEVLNEKAFLCFCFFCLLVSSAYAAHKIYGLTFMGSPWDISTNEMWNVQCWFDSLFY